MSNQPPTFGRMNRRQLVETTLIGGAATVALQSASALAQEKPKAAASAAGTSTSATPRGVTNPNLSPPLLAIKGGKLRGLREGKTFTFLGIRYAEAERFGQPKEVQPWEGIKNAQVWGPVCPIPRYDRAQLRRTRLPASLLAANEHCQ